MLRRLLVVLLACATLLPAWEKEPAGVYAQRRAALRKELNSGITVLFGAVEENDAIFGFRQQDDFYYLTGIDEPGAMLMLIPPVAGEKFPSEILFLPSRNLVREKWTGVKVGPDDPGIAAKLSFDAVASTKVFQAELMKMLPAFNALYTLGASEQLKTLAPFAEFNDARRGIARLRMVKGATEQKLIEKAVACSVDAHRVAFSAVKPGLYEYEIAALMEYTYHKDGCLRPAYDSIVGSGFNSTVLHYDRNERRMGEGELVVMDVAGEYSGYAADITRTLPVSGKFTARQREIYEIVLAAQNAAIAAIKPGMTMGRGENSVDKVARDYINSHGKDLKGEPLGKYFIHGLGHHVGLRVHDANDPTRPLAAGMVVTVEPGIYIPEESLGVRIEDMVLVTETGAKLLSASLPRDPAEIERIMAAAKK